MASPPSSPKPPHDAPAALAFAAAPAADPGAGVTAQAPRRHAGPAMSKVLLPKKGAGAPKKGGLGAKKLTEKVDAGIYAQSPAAPESTPTRGDGGGDEGAAPPARSDRFAYDGLVNAAASAKGREVKRGDDIFGDMAVTAPQPVASHAAHRVAEEDADATAQKRFADAKSISSDTYHGRDRPGELDTPARDTRLQRFQGAQAISSSDFYGDDEAPRGAGDFLDEGAAALVGRLAVQARNDVEAMKRAAGKIAGIARSFL